MKRYPAYKPSGVQWLGEIPGHFEFLPLKRFVKINTATLSETVSPDYELQYLDIGNVDSSGISGELQGFKFSDAPSRARRIIKPGDTVISTVRTYLKAIAHIPECEDNWIASTGFAVLTPEADTLPKYVSYIIRSDGFIDSVTKESKGVNYPAITSVELGNLKVVATRSLEEQTAIAAYLDHKNADIDGFVSSKRMLIALLNEERAAFIQKIVLRGLNPDAPVKQTGAMFIGEVPAHWEVKRAKYFFSEIDERSETGDEELLSVSHITGVTPRSEKNVNMFLAESYEGSKVCIPGDLVINTMWAWMGAMGVSRHRGIVSPSYGVYRQRNGSFLPEYLDHLARAKSYIAEYICRSTGIQESRLRLYPDQFFNVRMICPPLSEQRAIVTEIEEQSQRIDGAISRIEREIELINEYRTALISEVVTGKIDVRDRD